MVQAPQIQMHMPVPQQNSLSQMPQYTPSTNIGNRNVRGGVYGSKKQVGEVDHSQVIFNDDEPFV